MYRLGYHGKTICSETPYEEHDSSVEANGFNIHVAQMMSIGSAPSVRSRSAGFVGHLSRISGRFFPEVRVIHGHTNDIT